MGQDEYSIEYMYEGFFFFLNENFGDFVHPWHQRV